jgi:putative hydrolase of the HAD superfamily
MQQAEASLIEHLHTDYPLTKDKNLSFWRAHKTQVLKANPDLANDMGLLRKQVLLAGLQECGYQGDQLETAAEDCYAFFYYERSCFKVPDNVHSVLADLANRVPLVAITNGNVNLREIGIDQYFTHCFKANIKQPMKPDRAMFDLAAQALSLPHQHILHIGDSLINDVWGAYCAGMRSAWYAADRDMHLNNEPVKVLPDVQLDSLDELLSFV